MARSLDEFEVLDSTPIEGGGLDHRARVRSNGEELRLWVGSPGRGADPGSPTPEEIVRRFGKVHQSSLPRLLEGSLDRGRALFLVQPYRGVGLQERITSNSVSIPDAIDIAKGIGAALAKAHAQGFVHGQVDERAIFLHEDGRPLLLYFGLGSFLDPRPARAPEDLAGPPSETADVFGLSRVLFRLVTGVDPYERAAPAEDVLALRMGARFAADELSAEIPEGLRRFLVRSIHPDPALRIRRAEEFAGDLRVLRASWDTLSIPVQSSIPFPPRRVIALWGAALAVVLGAVALARGCGAFHRFTG